MNALDLKEIFRPIADHSDPHGDFLSSFAEAFVRADRENAEILMAAAEALAIKYRLGAGVSEDRYSVAPDGLSITCHVCGRTSHHPKDVMERYCGYCHVFHSDPVMAQKWLKSALSS